MGTLAQALPPRAEIESDVADALQEDIGTGDVTAALLPDSEDVAYLLCKEDGVLAGSAWFELCHRALDPSVEITWFANDGDRIYNGTVLALLKGHSRAIVTAERSSLNFLQTLSGTATTVRRYVDAIGDNKLRVLDTRKTIPGLRHAQKYAVLCGGGMNHRFGLFDTVMLKENHIRAAGSIANAVASARAKFPDLPLVIEVENLDELRQALETDCTRILIDNFSPELRREAVHIAAGRIPLEVSGNVTFENIAEIAADGVDFVSIGGLTKHLHALDLSLKLGPPPSSVRLASRQ